MNVGGFYWLARHAARRSAASRRRCASSSCSSSAPTRAGASALMGWLYGRATARGWPAPIVFLARLRGERARSIRCSSPGTTRRRCTRCRCSCRSPSSAGRSSSGSCSSRANLAIAEPLLARLERARARVSARCVARRRVVGAGALARSLLSARVRIPHGRTRASRRPSRCTSAIVQGEHGPHGRSARTRRGAASPPQMTARAPRRRASTRRLERDVGDASRAREDMRRSTLLPRSTSRASLGVPDHLRRASLYRVDPDPRALVQHGALDRRAGRGHRPLRQAVPPRVRRVPPLRRHVPDPLQVVAATAGASRRARRSIRSSSTSAGTTHKVTRAHLLRGHPPRLHERAVVATPIPSCS